MKKLITIFFITLFIGAGCEKDYQSPIIGTWQGYEIVDGEITFDMPVTWDASFDTWRARLIFKVDYSGEYITSIEDFVSTSKFTYEIDKKTITMYYQSSPQEIWDYSIEGNELILGEAKYLKQ